MQEMGRIIFLEVDPQPRAAFFVGALGRVEPFS